MNIIGNGGLSKQIVDVVNTFTTYSITHKGRIKPQLNALYLSDVSSKINDSYIIGFAALNNLEEREAVVQHLFNEGKKLDTIIAPSAIVSQDATIEPGAVILHKAFIGPGVLLDLNVLVGTGVIIEHDSMVGQHSVVLTGAIINGDCNIGCRNMIGSGAIIIQGIRTCDDVYIGAGAVVVKDILEPGTYIGNPAKKIK